MSTLTDKNLLLWEQFFSYFSRPRFIRVRQFWQSYRLLESISIPLKNRHSSCSVIIIAETRIYNTDPLKPHFYIVKLGFTGVYIIFLSFAQKHRLWVLVRTASSRQGYQDVWYTYENYQNFSSENVHFLMVKFPIYLNRRVFVMSWKYLLPFNQSHTWDFQNPFSAWFSGCSGNCSISISTLYSGKNNDQLYDLTEQ